MNWYYVKVVYIDDNTRRRDFSSLIINCHPSEIYNQVFDKIKDGYARKIIDIVKL